MAQTFIPDAFKSGKVLASNPRWGHAAALFGTDGQNYLFKDSGPGLTINVYYYLSNVKYCPKNSLLDKILKVPIEESDHVRNGWWIDFRNVSSVQNFALTDDDLD